MIKIKFNDTPVLLDAGFARDGEHIITLSGILTPNTSGFTTWRNDGITQLGDFSGYTTVYRQLDDGVQLSDDGSIYQEPEELPEPPPSGPSIEERLSNVENATDELVLMMADIIGG